MRGRIVSGQKDFLRGAASQAAHCRSHDQTPPTSQRSEYSRSTLIYTLSIALKLVARGLSTTKNHIHSSSDRRPTMLVCATARSLLLRSSAAKRFGIGRRGQLFSLFSTSSAFNTTTNRIRLFTGTDCSLCDVVKETLYEVQKEVSSSVA